MSVLLLRRRKGRKVERKTKSTGKRKISLDTFKQFQYRFRCLTVHRCGFKIEFPGQKRMANTASQKGYFEVVTKMVSVAKNSTLTGWRAAPKLADWTQACVWRSVCAVRNIPSSAQARAVYVVFLGTFILLGQKRFGDHLLRNEKVMGNSEQNVFGVKQSVCACTIKWQAKSRELDFLSTNKNRFVSVRLNGKQWRWQQ